MSAPEPPEVAAFRQLEQLVRHLGDELAAFRRRAQAAEARVRALEALLAQPRTAGEDAVAALEAENAALRARVQFATDRTRQVLSRVQFLRQQQSRPVAPTAPAVTTGGEGA